MPAKLQTSDRSDDEIRQAVLKEVENDLEAWESFYEKFKDSFERIRVYEQRIKKLEEEIKARDSVIKKKLEKEFKTIVALSSLFLIVVAIFINILSQSTNPWLYFAGGALISFGIFSILYLLGLAK
jgi:cysteinyl-tRNA synthetase